ncbi:hypothetical protein [Parendozoicomonas haliclonae]|uniref:Uncharacterized protein n=1 Tax=Parendozoicomonas haliclonae TaxID=1960125 RepID=A0A1X7ASD7_9GAMM|nr:hypothetical protein [Parendozoicomonas haliclonae]SMA50980.1 hypothetical protein EHSB41UT_04803 [Parendozoicomonas haliclonae]
MKNIILAALLTLICIPSFGSSTAKFCSKLKFEMQKLHNQMPLEVDNMTTAVGIQTLLVGNQCLVNYSYLINTKKFIDDMLSSGELTTSEAYEHISSRDGRNDLQEIFNDIAIGSVNSSMKTFKKLPNMKITYTYRFDDLKITPFVAVGLDNNSK